MGSLAVFADHCADGSGEPRDIMLRRERRAGNAADHVHAARLALAQLPRHLPYALNTPPHYECAWSSPRICCMDIGVSEPAHYADMPRGGRVLMIAEDGLDRGDDCREPVAPVAADRYAALPLA